LVGLIVDRTSEARRALPDVGMPGKDSSCTGVILMASDKARFLDRTGAAAGLLGLGEPEVVGGSLAARPRRNRCPGDEAAPTEARRIEAVSAEYIRPIGGRDVDLLAEVDLLVKAGVEESETSEGSGESLRPLSCDGFKSSSKPVRVGSG
jgi:hypothetical protein